MNFKYGKQAIYCCFHEFQGFHTVIINVCFPCSVFHFFMWLTGSLRKYYFSCINVVWSIFLVHKCLLIVKFFLLYILKKMSCDFCACEISNVFVVSNEEESWYIFCLVEFLLCSQWLKLCFPLLKCTATLFVWKPFVRILSCYGR